MDNIEPFPPDAIIFDMDGVICDTSDFHLRAFQELAQQHGLSLTAEEFQHLFGMENRKLLPKMFGRELPTETVRELADWKEARYREMIGSEITLMPGVAELIGWLGSSGRRAAVASSAPRANVEQILRSTGLIDKIEVYLACEDVDRHKPEPDVFIKAAERLGVPREDCWVIEDSLHGIQAGRSANITTIAVATTHPRETLGIANAVFDDVLAVYQAIRSVECE